MRLKVEVPVDWAELRPVLDALEASGATVTLDWSLQGIEIIATVEAPAGIEATT